MDRSGHSEAPLEVRAITVRGGTVSSERIGSSGGDAMNDSGIEVSSVCFFVGIRNYVLS